MFLGSIIRDICGLRLKPMDLHMLNISMHLNYVYVITCRLNNLVNILPNLLQINVQSNYLLFNI